MSERDEKNFYAISESESYKRKAEINEQRSGRRRI